MQNNIKNSNEKINSEKTAFANHILFGNLIGEGEKFLRDNSLANAIKAYSKVFEIFETIVIT